MVHIETFGQKTNFHRKALRIYNQFFAISWLVIYLVAGYAFYINNRFIIVLDYYIYGLIVSFLFFMIVGLYFYYFEKHHYFELRYQQLYKELIRKYKVGLGSRAIWHTIFAYKAFSGFVIGFGTVIIIHKHSGIDALDPNSVKTFMVSVFISGSSLFSVMTIIDLLEKTIAKNVGSFEALPLKSLYLRDFRVDKEKVRIFDSSWLNNIVSASFEDFLFQNLRNFTRPLAFGEPGETLPPSTSIIKRQYLNLDENWQDIVSQHIADSDIIFFHVGETDWLRWEFMEICNKDQVHNCMFIFPQKITGKILKNWKLMISNSKLASEKLLLDGINIEESIACFFNRNGEIFSVSSLDRCFSDYQSAIFLYLYSCSTKYD